MHQRRRRRRRLHLHEPGEARGLAECSDAEDLTPVEKKKGFRSCTMDRRPLVSYELPPPEGHDLFQLENGIVVSVEAQDAASEARRKKAKAVKEGRKAGEGKTSAERRA